MLIECNTCDSRVQAKEIGRVEMPIDYAGIPSKYSLVACSVCGAPMVGYTEMFQVGLNEFEWGNYEREWPEPKNPINIEIPNIARISLVEAETCFRAKAYSATAVMCGRAIEGVCKHHNPKTKTLASGLKDLRDKKIIDTRIFEWGEELRKARNLGAHATTEEVGRADAKDLLDFCSAICDYVFVLNAKFERFKERAGKS